MANYRNLIAWQKAMDLVDNIYTTVRSFPSFEQFGLAHQMRTAATSIPCNIAEGRGRYTKADQCHFYRQARGSIQELKTQIEIAVRQHFIEVEAGRTLMKQAIEVAKLLSGLLKTVS